jgi:hypothetical protein
MPLDIIADENGLPFLYLEGAEEVREYTPKTGSGTGQTSSQSEDWYTHQEIITLVHELYNGPPDLDPMSCAKANLTVQAREFYTAEVDGLMHPWYGRVLWNPPWGGTNAAAVKKRGLKKLLDAYHAGKVTECICVLNANATTTAWFKPLLSFPICFPSHRIKHYGPNGEGGSPNSGTVIIYLGARVDCFAQVFAELGAVMIPYVAVDLPILPTHVPFPSVHPA